MGFDVSFVPYLLIGYLAVAWIGGLIAVARYKKRLDGEVVRFAQERNLAMGEGHRLSGTLEGAAVALSPLGVAVRSGSDTARLAATRVTVGCDPAHRYVVRDRQRRFAEAMPQLDHTVGTSDPDFDGRFLVQTAEGGPLPFGEEALVLRSLREHELVWAEAKKGQLEAVFASDRANDERLGSFAHLERVLHTTLCMAEPRAARRLEPQLTAPSGGAPVFPRSIYGFALGMVGGFGLMVWAGETLDGGLPELGLVVDWHFFFAGFAVAHLLGTVLVIVGQALWRASRRTGTVAAARREAGGPYR